MSTDLTKEIPAQTIDNGITVALIEPDGSLNVWTVTVEAFVFSAWCRVGAQFVTLTPASVGQGGARVICTAMLDGVSQWRVRATTPANLQPGELGITSGPQPITIPGGALVVLEGTSIPVPPVAGGAPKNIAYVATPANGGNDALGQIGNPFRPFATINAGIAACLALFAFERPGVVLVAAGTYLEEVFVPAGPVSSGLALVAQGEVLVDATGLGDAFTIAASTDAGASAFKSFTMSGRWLLKASGTQVFNVQGIANPAGYAHMGSLADGGLRFEGITFLDGFFNLKFLQFINFVDCQTVNTSVSAVVDNVSLLAVASSNLPNLQQSFDPLVSLDTALPPVGVLIKVGSSVGNCVLSGASRLSIDKGAVVGSVDTTAWAEFFSGGVPAYDMAPALLMQGDTTLDQNVVIPAESAGTEHTLVSYRQSSVDGGDLTLAKNAGVSRVSVDCQLMKCSNPIDVQGLVDASLLGAQYNPATLSVVGAATVDRSEDTFSGVSVVGSTTVSFPIPYPAGSAAGMSFALTPRSPGSAATDAYVVGATDADVEFAAIAAGVTYDVQITRNPLPWACTSSPKAPARCATW